MGSFQNLCDKKAPSPLAGEGWDQPLEFGDYWNADAQAELYHFIGKDILYFHALFWPAMLQFAGFRTPTQVFAHGFLTVNGEKMSKSRGTFITAESYLQQGLNPEWLRYYYACKLNGSMEDADLNLEDFVLRVNSDLVGKYINIASRTAGFVSKRFDGRVAGIDSYGPAESKLHDTLLESAQAIAQHYEERDFGKAVREIMRLADLVNEYVAAAEPWAIAKDPANDARLHVVCSAALRLFAMLTLYLKPVLPRLAQQVEQELFGLQQGLAWSDLDDLPLTQIQPYKHLMTRVDPKQVEAWWKPTSNPCNRRRAPPPKRATPSTSTRRCKPRKARWPTSASTTSAKWTCASPRSSTRNT